GGAGTLRLFVGTAQVDALAVAPGETSKTFAVVNLEEGANALRAELTNAAGTKSCAIATVTVATIAGAISIVQPITGSKLTLVQDARPDVPGIQSLLSYSAQ